MPEHISTITVSPSPPTAGPHPLPARRLLRQPGGQGSVCRGWEGCQCSLVQPRLTRPCVADADRLPSPCLSPVLFCLQGKPEIKGMQATTDAHCVTATFTIHNKASNPFWELFQVGGQGARIGVVGGAMGGPTGCLLLSSPLEACSSPLHGCLLLSTRPAASTPACCCAHSLAPPPAASPPPPVHAGA